MRFAIGFALYTCLIYSAPEPYMKRIVTIFLLQQGGRFYVSNCKSNKSLTQNAFSVRPLFDLQFASEPYTKRIVTIFLLQQEGGVFMFQTVILC